MSSFSFYPAFPSDIWLERPEDRPTALHAAATLDLIADSLRGKGEFPAISVHVVESERGVAFDYGVLSPSLMIPRLEIPASLILEAHSTPNLELASVCALLSETLKNFYADGTLREKTTRDIEELSDLLTSRPDYKDKHSRGFDILTSLVRLLMHLVHNSWSSTLQVPLYRAWNANYVSVFEHNGEVFVTTRHVRGPSYNVRTTTTRLNKELELGFNWTDLLASGAMEPLPKHVEAPEGFIGGVLTGTWRRPLTGNFRGSVGLYRGENPLQPHENYPTSPRKLFFYRGPLDLPVFELTGIS